MKDWMVNRYFGCISMLISGLCADWRWMSCAVAWLIVSVILLVWSYQDQLFYGDAA